MHLEIKEGSACILVEKSRQTEPFIPAIKELIIDLLLEKCNPGNASNPFRFNIGQFDKEPMFWADRVWRGFDRAALSKLRHSVHISGDSLHNG